MIRIPLKFVDDRISLVAVVECAKLRVQRQMMEFIIDTGSNESFLSAEEAIRLQIPMKTRESTGQVDFGGSRFNKIDLPAFEMHLLKEGQEGHITLVAGIKALKTTKLSAEKVGMAMQLPSILGMDFLREHRMSLHVIPAENLAFLELD